MKILGLCGRARSGKDSFADISGGVLPGLYRTAFAAPLKEMVSCLVPLTEESKDAPLDWLDGITPRRLLQTLGTEWGRALHPDLWVRLALRRIADSGCDHAIVTDVRFPNEVNAIKAAGGKILWVQRPDGPLIEDHVSERMDFGSFADEILVNDSDLAAFRGKVISFVQRWRES